MMLVLAASLFSLNIEASGFDHRGHWKCNQSGVEIDIIPTDYGIRVRQHGHNQWNNYDEYFNDYYRDLVGNHYKWRNDALFYESSCGTIKHRFTRVNSYNVDRYGTCAPNHYGEVECTSGHDAHDGYGGYGYGTGYNEYENESYGRGLDGVWFAERGRSIMRIQNGYRGLSAKFDRNRRWIDFRQSRRNQYQDGRGNRIKILNRNRIQWTSDCGRYKKTYVRGRRGHRNW